MAIFHQDGFSSVVNIYLEVRGQVHSVAQVGENTLILRKTVPLERQSNAHVVIVVDGNRHVYPVVLREQYNELVFFKDSDVCNIADYQNIASAT